MKRILFFAAALVFLNSCNEEFKPATFEISSIENNYEADISVVYEKANDRTELGKRVNFNVDEAIIASLSIPEKKTSLEAVLKDFNSEYLNFKKEFSDETEPEWELHIETEKIYQSEDVITISISTYEFKGGAHGNDKIKLLNLDAKTGNVLTQNDIIENTSAFENVAKEYFLENLKTKNETQNIEDYFFGEPFQLPENIGFNENGLLLLYNTYEIASYAQGYTEFVIPFNDCESFLKVY